MLKKVFTRTVPRHGNLSQGTHAVFVFEGLSSTSCYNLRVRRIHSEVQLRLVSIERRAGWEFFLILPSWEKEMEDESLNMFSVFFLQRLIGMAGMTPCNIHK